MPQSSDHSPRSILDGSLLLRSLTDDEKIRLAAVSRVSTAERHEAIWLDGASAPFFGLVGEGFVKMMRANSSGAEFTLEIMGPGQIFGLLGVLNEQGCPLMAYGLTDVVYLRIPKAEFMKVYDVNHTLKDKLLRKTALRMHQKLDFMAKLSSGRAEERIAAILFILAESYGELDGKAVRLALPLTRQQIGEMSGTTTETTIRVLSKWARAGIVSTESHRITIEDPDTLELKLRDE